MAANYLHGIETTEVESGARVIKVVKSAVIAVVGSAPTGPVNTLTLAQTITDDAQFGPELSGFGIPEALAGIHAYGSGTVLVVNVLDPAVHREAASIPATTFGVNDLVQLEYGALQSLTLKSQDGATTYDEGVDYEVTMLTGKVKRLASGSGETAKLLIPLARAGQRGVADSDLQWHGMVRRKKVGKPSGYPAPQLYVRSWRPSGGWRPRWCASGS